MTHVEHGPGHISRRCPPFPTHFLIPQYSNTRLTRITSIYFRICGSFSNKASLFFKRHARPRPPRHIASRAAIPRLVTRSTTARQPSTLSSSPAQNLHTPRQDAAATTYTPRLSARLGRLDRHRPAAELAAAHGNETKKDAFLFVLVFVRREYIRRANRHDRRKGETRRILRGEHRTDLTGQGSPSAIRHLRTELRPIRRHIALRCSHRKPAAHSHLGDYWPSSPRLCL